MCNLIASELFKIVKSKVTYVVGGIFVTFALLQAALYAYMSSVPEMREALFGGDVITGIDGIVTPLNGDISYVIMGIFISIIVTQDFSTGSIRQIIGKGASKVKYVLAKYIAMVLTLLVCMAAYSLICFVTFSAIGRVGDFTPVVVKHLLFFGLGAFGMILGYTAIAEFLCILLRKNVIAITVNVLFMFIGGMLSQLIYYLTESTTVYGYWLASMSDSFCSFEVGIGQKINYIVIFLVLAVVFNALSALIFKKRDIE